jgi:hypothetical protein
VEECPELLANGAKVVLRQGVEVEHVEKVLYFDEREIHDWISRNAERLTTMDIAAMMVPIVGPSHACSL